MSVLATDDFAGTGALSANWTALAYVPNVSARLNNQANQASGRGSQYWNAVTWPNDQYAQVAVVQYGQRLILRAVNISGESNLYYFGCSTLSTDIEFVEYLNNSGGTTLQSGTETISGGDVIYAEIQGTTLIAKKNGTQILTATDATYSAGNVGFGLGNVNDDRCDNFEGGDFAAAGNNPKGPLGNPFFGPFGGPI